MDLCYLLSILIMQPASQSAGWSFISCGKNFRLGHHMQIFQPKSCMPAMLISTNDLNHFIPLSATVTLAGGHRFSGK